MPKIADRILQPTLQRQNSILFHSSALLECC